MPRIPELSPPQMLVQEVPFPQVVAVVVAPPQQLTGRGSGDAEASMVRTGTRDPDT